MPLTTITRITADMARLRAASSIEDLESSKWRVGSRASTGAGKARRDAVASVNGRSGRINGVATVQIFKAIVFDRDAELMLVLVRADHDCIEVRIAVVDARSHRSNHGDREEQTQSERHYEHCRVLSGSKYRSAVMRVSSAFADEQ